MIDRWNNCRQQTTSDNLHCSLVHSFDQWKLICQKKQTKAKPVIVHYNHNISIFSIGMTTRRGIFFNSKSRSIDSNLLVNEKNRSPPKIEPSTIILNEESGNSNSSGNSQTSPPKSTATAAAGIVKKKLILKSTKRTLTKTIYSGPRKIFSTSYKVCHACFCSAFISRKIIFRLIELNSIIVHFLVVQRMNMI